MRKNKTVEEVEEPLVDSTEALTLNSKRLERQRKKMEKKKAARIEPKTLFDLPYELIMDVLKQLRPCDLFHLCRASKSLNSFILDQQTILAKEIVQRRYQVMSKCFPLPILLENVDREFHPSLLSDDRLQSMQRKPFQHIKTLNPHLICSCLTCLMRWNGLSVIVDFAYWQDNLDQGEPIKMIERSKHNPEWNRKLLEANSSVIEKALRSPLWYSRILEAHLGSTVRSITRHTNNKGNKRKRFRMDPTDVSSETDAFLALSGPPTMDLPFHRDNYYMLEAYLPNRSWITEKQRWVYLSDSQHQVDIERVRDWAKRKEVKEAKAVKVVKAYDERKG